MRIALFTYGSWGDVRPLVVLARGLQAAGHSVRVIASPGYADWARARGVEYLPLRDDVSNLLNELSDSDITSPFEQMRIVQKVLPPIIFRMGMDVLEATRDTDVLVTMQISLGFLMGVIELNKLKTILIDPAPLSRTAEFSSAASPAAPPWFPFKRWYNRRFSYSFGQTAFWSLLSGPRKALDKALGTRKRSFRDFQTAVESAPSLTVVSPSVVPRPADWGPHQQVTGYLFDSDEDWTPPQDLVDFLDAGDPPVYIGFGSMPESRPEETTRMLIEGVQKAGKRAVILTGWAGLGLAEVPDSIHILKFASHNWLFPRMSAVVHHGGAGTTAAALRAGVPSVIVPFQADQPYWGRTIAALGAGTAPIPRKKLTAQNLAAAIREASGNHAIREKAQELGAKIGGEDGAAEAAAWVRRFLG